MFPDKWLLSCHQWWIHLVIQKTIRPLNRSCIQEIQIQMVPHRLFYKCRNRTILLSSINWILQCTIRATPEKRWWTIRMGTKLPTRSIFRKARRLTKLGQLLAKEAWFLIPRAWNHKKCNQLWIQKLIVIIRQTCPLSDEKQEKWPHWIQDLNLRATKTILWNISANQKQNRILKVIPLIIVIAKPKQIVFWIHSKILVKHGLIQTINQVRWMSNIMTKW